jgi:uncharacterized protein (DUF488 family)
VEVYSIGFGKHSAAEFFTTLKAFNIGLLLDVRLNNVSQLAGFTKREDLRFFLRELCNSDYEHDLDLAPTADLLKAYRGRQMTWTEYEGRFRQLLSERRIAEKIGPERFARPTVLLCSEPTAKQCHRRVVLEYLRDTSIPELEPIHLK